MEQEYSTIGFRFGAEPKDGGRKEECKPELETKVAEDYAKLYNYAKVPTSAFIFMTLPIQALTQGM